MFDCDALRPAHWRGHVRRHGGFTLAACALLGGCAPAKNPDQLIVKGDAFEVTLQEYDQLLRQAPPVMKEAVAPLRRALLQQLIEEKLFAEAATKAGMSDDIETSQAIAAARRGILAQAYIRNLTGKLPKPDPRDVERYYNDHAILFGDRRRFVVEEYVLRSDVPDLRTYLQVLDRSGFDALIALMADKNPGLTPVTAVRFSDELPDNHDGVLGKLNAGSNIVYQSPAQIHLGVVRAMTVEPLTLEEVRARIEQKLLEDRAAEIAAAAFKGLSNARHVEILKANLKQVASVDAKEATP